jgi:hypothetical protein
MKAITIFILLFPLMVFGQNLTGGGITEAQEPTHCYGHYSNDVGTAFSFNNSGFYYAFSTANLTWPELHNFTRSDSTITFNGGTGHLRVDLFVTMSGTNGNDIQMRLYNITDGAEVPTSQLQTVTGAGNRVILSLLCYDVNANTGDRYKFQIMNVSATASITIYRVMAFIQLVHLE